MPRRRAVGLLVTGLLGFGLSPKRAIAGGENVNPNLRYQGLKDTPCTDDMCSRGKICGVFSLPNKWGQKGCIKLGCCQGDQFCCAGPATAHGAVGGCCPKGFNCDNGKCVCNGKISFNKGFASASTSFAFGALQGQRCICPDERVCGSGCCKEGAQYMQCDCSKLAALQDELYNALLLQEAFRNKIPDLRKREIEGLVSMQELQRWAGSDARSGLKDVRGYSGPDHVDYVPWGNRFGHQDDCERSEESTKTLEEAKNKSGCLGIGHALQVHEDWHLNFCRTIGYRNYMGMRGSDRAQEEVEAYGEQIKVLRDILSHLGCS
jgi:hypothetical protein